MESFEVKLRQTLSCTHNTFTSPQEVEHCYFCCLPLPASKRSVCSFATVLLSADLEN